jgi:hypothetical protein
LCNNVQQMLSYRHTDELFHAATNSANAYPDDLAQDLGPQILSFGSSFKYKIKHFNNLHDLSFMLMWKIMS